MTVFYGRLSPEIHHTGVTVPCLAPELEWSLHRQTPLFVRGDDLNPVPLANTQFSSGSLARIWAHIPSAPRGQRSTAGAGCCLSCFVKNGKEPLRLWKNFSRTSLIC